MIMLQLLSVLTFAAVCRRHPVTPFCDTVRASPLQLTCREDQLAVAVCNLQKYPQQLPLEYQVSQKVRKLSQQPG